MSVVRGKGSSLRKKILIPGAAGLIALSATAADETSSLVTGNTAFAVDLYAQLKGKDGNLFFSPYSISTCLGMTYAGARGKTEQQMAQVLHFKPDQAAVHAAFGSLQRELNAIQQKTNIELNLANALWARQGHPFLPAFLKIAADDYEAKLKQVDFAREAESARGEINGWVLERTKGKIHDLIGPGMLGTQTAMVLVNAIYFKGAWTRIFNTNLTTTAPFHVAAGRDVQARMMNQTAEFRYAELDGAQVLELPYRGGDLSMLVALPRETNGLKALEATFDSQRLTNWLKALTTKKVNVLLPRFKLEAQFLLNGTLTDMGMRDPFSGEADFSGMDGERDLFISAVVHKAFVEVNEEGTEAAAATAVTMALMRAVPKPEPIVNFRADHPFLFLIRDNHSGSILFLGRLADPTG